MFISCNLHLASTQLYCILQAFKQRGNVVFCQPYWCIYVYTNLQQRVLKQNFGTFSHAKTSCCFKTQVTVVLAVKNRFCLQHGNKTQLELSSVQTQPTTSGTTKTNFFLLLFLSLEWLRGTPTIFFRVHQDKIILLFWLSYQFQPGG